MRSNLLFLFLNVFDIDLVRFRVLSLLKIKNQKKFENFF